MMGVESCGLVNFSAPNCGSPPPPLESPPTPSSNANKIIIYDTLEAHSRLKHWKLQLYSKSLRRQFVLAVQLISFPVLKHIKMNQNKFTVIVVGGGPVGLTAAHILSRAGIEFFVLERRSSIQIDVGASLALWPQGLRVLSQLGLLDRLQELGEEMGRTVSVSLEGYKYKETWATETMKVK